MSGVTKRARSQTMQRELELYREWKSQIESMESNDAKRRRSSSSRTDEDEVIGIDNIHESGKTEEDSKFDLEFKQKLDEREQGIEVAKGDGNGIGDKENEVEAILPTGATETNINLESKSKLEYLKGADNQSDNEQKEHETNFNFNTECESGKGIEENEEVFNVHNLQNEALQVEGSKRNDPSKQECFSTQKSKSKLGYEEGEDIVDDGNQFKESVTIISDGEEEMPFGPKSRKSEMKVDDEVEHDIYYWTRSKAGSRRKPPETARTVSNISDSDLSITFSETTDDDSSDEDFDVSSVRTGLRSSYSKVVDEQEQDGDSSSSDEDEERNENCVTRKEFPGKNSQKRRFSSSTGQQVVDQHGFKEGYGVSRTLLYSILDEKNIVPEEEASKQAKNLPSAEYALPLKFTFELEKPEPVEKSDIDKLTDDLFAEMEFALRSEEMGSLA